MLKDQLLQYLSGYVQISEDEASELMRHDLVKYYKKGEILLREGDYSNKSYFVLKGCIRSYYLGDGEERTTAFYVENEPVMPVCVSSGTASTSFLACVEDSILSVSTPDMEEAFFQKFPRFERVCRIMSERMLAQKQMSYERYISSSPEQRYLFLQEERPDLLNRVPQYQLASFLGIKPESLSRIRKRLARK